MTEEDIRSLLEEMGKKLTSLRKAEGYKNYETFAYENAIPRAQYGRYERGQGLKLSSLLKVLHALGIKPSDFFGQMGQ